MYQPQITTDEFFNKMNEMYPTESARVLAEMRAEAAEAHIREMEQKLPEEGNDGRQD